MVAPSSLHDDARLLDALEQAQIQHAPSAATQAPQEVRERLAQLCERHGLQASPDVLEAAVQNYLAPEAADGSRASSSASKPGGPSAALMWQRPTTVAAWQQALETTGRAMNTARSLEQWHGPLVTTLILGAAAVLLSHSTVTAIGIDVFAVTSFGLWLRAYLRHRRRCAGMKQWLVTPLADAIRLPQQARRHLARARDLETADSFQRWKRAPANRPLLAALVTSEVPLLAGDVAVLDANMQDLPSPQSEVSGTCYDWNRHLNVLS